jgi:hypothetical protein
MALPWPARLTREGGNLKTNEQTNNTQKRRRKKMTKNKQSKQKTRQRNKRTILVPPWQRFIPFEVRTNARYS